MRLAWAVGLWVAWASVAQSPQGPLWGVGFDEALAGPGGLAQALSRPSPAPSTHPIHIRLIATRAELEPAPGRYEFAALDARLAEYRRLSGVDVYLDIRGAAPTPDLMADWTRFIQALATHAGSGLRGYIVGVDAPAGQRSEAAAFAFFVKTTAIDLRATDSDASVILGGIADPAAAWLDALYDADIAPYVDAIALSPDRPVDQAVAIVTRRDPSCAIVIGGAPLGDAAENAAERFAARHLEVLGSRVTGVTYAASPAVVAAALPAVALLRDLIDQPLEAIDDASSGLALTRAGGGNPAPVRHRLIFGVDSAATYLVYFSDGQPVDLAITDPSGARPVIRDPVRLMSRATETFAFDADLRRATMRLPGAAWPLIVDWSAGNASTHVERAGVSRSVLPTVAEIIARNQQAQAAQDALVATVIADATMSQQFRPNVADPGYDVVTENRYFAQGKQTELEELSFRLNGTKWGKDRPAFPMLQAEKVLSLPLDLRLTSDYRYAYDGDGLATVDGRECFVLRFDPVRADQSLYRGTVWIDRQTYLKAKVHTVQTELGAPVLSSEETQRFDKVGSLGGRDVYLLTELVGRQNVMLAGRSLMVERRLTFRDFQLNPADFDTQRQAAHTSDHVMYRDTDRGVRYLVKRNGERVVDDRTTKSATALLLGVQVDPSYDYPLPLGGLNYLNFEFLGPESQLAVLFAGVLGAVNAQRPHLIGDKVDGSVETFAMALWGSDRTYDAQGERPAERVRTRPLTAGVNLGWRVTERTRLLANYQFRYDQYSREDTTAPDFQPPSSTATHGLGLGLEWRRGGYAVAAAWAGYERSRWAPWGNVSDFDPKYRTYTRDSLSLTKDFFSGFHKFHLNAAYYGGRNLDRFSQYQFGFFDEQRIHGVPSSGVRFSELGMFRAAYSFNLFDQFRVELSVDHAYGRDPWIGPAWQRITGVGTGFLVRGPFGTMIRGDIGKSFLPDRYAKPGSFVFQLQLLKPL